jgi:ATP-dependent RNA helicase SUPV3L1/SUV3
VSGDEHAPSQELAAGEEASVYAANDNMAPAFGEPATGDTVQATAAEAPAIQDNIAPIAPSDQPAASAETAAGETPAAEAASAIAASGEPEFEEVWRFRRPKPKFERGEGAGSGRPHHRRGQGAGDGRDRGNRPNQDRPRQQAAGAAPGQDRQQPPQQGEQKDRAPGANQGQRHGSGENRERGGHRHRQGDAGQRHARPQGQAAPAEAGAEAKPQDASQRQQPQGAQQHRQHGRPGDNAQGRGRDSRPPRHQDKFRSGGPGGGSASKKPYTVTAAPKKSSGAVDPDSPFAALVRLKEQLEKQKQDEAV